jgi:hypothetical protein
MSTTELPVVPFDGMKFVDAWQRQWEYSIETKTWIFKGYLPNIPLANESTIGLLSSNLKTLLDSIPEKAGGFGILTKFSFGKVIGDGFNGLMTGDIILKSNTLDIKCRDQHGKLITKSCTNAPSSPEANLIPSIDINFGSDFLDTICIEVPGSQGPKGIQGPPGEDGEDGFGDGPQGLTGDPGNNATGISEVNGVTIEIDESFYDTAVVNVELDQQNSILSITKAKLAVPDNDTPADRFVVMPIIRSLEWTTGIDYNIIAPAGENLGLEGDVGVLAYPKDFNPDLQDADIEMSRKALSDFINQIIGDYKVIYDKYIAEYDQEIKDFIYAKDDEARKVLDSLVAQLAAKQFSETFEYCMGMADNGSCVGLATWGQQMANAANAMVVSIQEIAKLLALIVANTTPSSPTPPNPTASAAEIYDINSIDNVFDEIGQVLKTKTNFSIPSMAVSSSTYSSDLCNYAPQILEASGEVTYNNVCPDIQSQLLAKVILNPGDKYYVKNGVGGVELPGGAYLVQYTDGAVYDGSQQDCGYIVGSGGVTRGLVLNVEKSNVITKIPLPMSSQISDPHDKNQVINSYLTGPITEMAIGSFADDGDKIWLEMVVSDPKQSSGSVTLMVKYCARCTQ